MIPYNGKKLRCDPLLSQIVGTDNKDTSIGSGKVIMWTCSVCETQFKSRVQNMYVSCGRCKTHTNEIRIAGRVHYDGDVPKLLIRPIRAGLLQAIGTDQLITLIATLEPIPSQVSSALDPAAAASAVARGYVESIVAGNYTRVQLLDSVFWGDDTVTRKDGHKYVHPPRKRPRVVAPPGGGGDPLPADAPPAGLQVAAPLGGERNPPATHVPSSTTPIYTSDNTDFTDPALCGVPFAEYSSTTFPSCCTGAETTVGADDESTNELVVIKQEPRDTTFFRVDLGLCGDPYCRDLACRVHRTVATNSPGEKREQRNAVLDAVDAARRAAWGSRRGVNGWWLDDTMVNPDGTMTSLTMEALARANADVANGGAEMLRLFSPNLKRCVVDHLRVLDPHHRPGTVVTGVGCACVFLRHWAEEIRTRAPLDVVMVDGFGGIENNVLRIVRLMVELRLFRPGAGVQPGVPPVQMMVVFSDRYDRAETGSVMAAVIKALVELPKLFSVSPYALTIRDHRAYGATMHVIECMVTDREWVHSDLDGFIGRVLYACSQS